MKILFLGPSDSPLIQYLKRIGEEVINTSEKIDLEFILKEKPEFLISYGYRHIIKKQILDCFPKKAINLHISFLPWNRGVSPNLWSFFDNSPSGVTIHYLNEGIDTGDIITQERVTFPDNETLKGSYSELQKRIQELFKNSWPAIKKNQIKGKKQFECGSYHTLKQTKDLLQRLPNGWDTLISEVKKMGLNK